MSAEPIEFDPPETAPAPVARRTSAPARRDVTGAGLFSRDLPNVPEAEEGVIAGCLMGEPEGVEVLRRTREAGLTPGDFYGQPNQMIYRRLLAMDAAGIPLTPSLLASELTAHDELATVGGIPYVMQVSGYASTLHASYCIAKVREQSLLREIIRTAAGAIEACYDFSGGIDEFAAAQLARLKAVADGAAIKTRSPLVSLMDFAIPPEGDASILLGHRYLNRGDGAVLAGTSGMGKSSLSVQMATLFALGRPAFGIPPNGALRSLIVQSEDSDGDVGEMQCSVCHSLQLSTVERAAVGSSVKVWTERVLRGDRFLAALRAKVAEFKPDLVWVNPLQAFMQGDITKGEDVSRFLREGLNGLNPAAFGCVIVHHTTKPATGKNRADRLWHEVMYDMAGGAEIINWARVIISLRAAADEGQFNLVLAKRGRRAGVTKTVEQGAGFRLEPMTTIPLRHAKGFIPAAQLGLKKDLPLIFWEGREADARPETAKGGQHDRGARVPKHDLTPFMQFIPAPGTKPLTVGQLHRFASDLTTISAKEFKHLLNDAAESGLLERLLDPALGLCYRKRS